MESKIYTQWEAIKMMMDGENMLPCEQNKKESIISYFFCTKTTFRVMFKSGMISNPKDMVNLSFSKWMKYSDLRKVKPGETFTFNGRFFIIVKTAETTYRVVDTFKWESDPKINVFGLTIDKCLHKIA